MKHFINFLILFSVFILPNCAFAQEYQNFKLWQNYKGTPEQSVIINEYIIDYTSTLYDKLDIIEGFPKLGVLWVGYDYYIHRDGTISNFSMYWNVMEERIDDINKYLHPFDYYAIKNYDKKFEEYVKKIIIDNPPKPFPKEIDYDVMWITLEVKRQPLAFHESRRLRKNFSYAYFIDKKKFDHCSFNTGSGDFFSKSGRYIPPRWKVGIVKF